MPWLRIYAIIMLFPTTFLTIFLCYIILTKSTPAMRKYKYIMLSVALGFYQFDLVYSFLTCPVPLPSAYGVQFVGILGLFFLHSGNYLGPLVFLSMAIIGLTIVASFVWREYSVFEFDTKPVYLALHVLHFAFTTCMFFLFIPLYNGTLSDEVAVTQYLKEKNSTYDPDYAVFCVIIPEKNNEFLTLFLYCIAFSLFLSIYIFKAVYRIKTFLKNLATSQSTRAVKLHQSQLTSLILQGIIPVLLLCAAICTQLIVLQILPLVLDVAAFQLDLIQRELTTIILSLPSLYSTTHFLTVVCSTQPYRRYILSQGKRPSAMISVKTQN